MMDAIDLAVLTGDGIAPAVSGFFDASSGSLTYPTTTPATIASYADYLYAIGQSIDGRYANGADSVKMLVGAETAGHMVSTPPDR